MKKTEMYELVSKLNHEELEMLENCVEHELYLSNKVLELSK